MPSLRLVMMGTGDFAVPTFASLYQTPHQVVGLYTQPDRAGRGHSKQPPNRMKEVALARGTPVFQPENVNTPEALAELRSLSADVFVVAAYGQILSAELLSIPRLGPINVHASLLPKYRGAAPINYAILKGETETGVTVIEITPKLDAGAILGVVKTPIDPHETAGQLEERLSQLAVPLLGQVLDQLAAGTVQRLPQDPQLVTRAPKMSKAMGAIPWEKSAAEIDWHIRAMQPWPSPYTFARAAGRKPLRVLILAVEHRASDSTLSPGTILRADKHELIVQTGQDAVAVLQVQPEGKRAMSAAEFLRGYPLAAGDRFGPDSPEAA